MSKPLDYLIIGQGLAGTLLARLLLQSGKSVHIIDASHRDASTKIAAGIVNPITGRRYAKSWLYHELFPVAKKMYQHIEQETGLQLFREKKLIRVLINAEQENEWHARSAWPEMEGHMAGPPNHFPCQQHFKDVFALATTLGAAQVNIADLISYYQHKWSAEGLLYQDDFSHDLLNITPTNVRYKELEAKQIIFCEGAKVVDNPWFKDLPWNLSKGEVLHLHIPGYTTNYLLKHHLMYAPINKEQYWVGSNYEWNTLDPQPSDSGKQWLLKRIKKDLQTPYHIVQHRAALRPTVEDRRPLIGRHPVHRNLILFNGLGTKGTSLGPFFARQLVDYLLKKGALHPEADIARV